MSYGLVVHPVGFSAFINKFILADPPFLKKIMWRRTYNPLAGPRPFICIRTRKDLPPEAGGPRAQNLLAGALCLKMREPSLNETDAPPRRRSLTLATQQKSFLRIFYFARARFFLLKGKENFFAGFCSERAGWRGFASARARRNSPHTPLPPRPRLGWPFFRRIWKACQFHWRAAQIY